MIFDWSIACSSGSVAFRLKHIPSDTENDNCSTRDCTQENQCHYESAIVFRLNQNFRVQQQPVIFRWPAAIKLNTGFQIEERSIFELLKHETLNLRVFALHLFVNVFENQIIIDIKSHSTFEFCSEVDGAEQVVIFFPIFRLSVAENTIYFPMVDKFMEKQKTKKFTNLKKFQQYLTLDTAKRFCRQHKAERSPFWRWAEAQATAPLANKCLDEVFELLDFQFLRFETKELLGILAAKCIN